MDRTEISEIFCGAVDTIINARLKNLAYDITKEFVITKNDLQRQGLYTVSDGSVSFEAYSYDKTLKVNDKVMVTIPNGDYNSNKIITAKIEPEKPDMSTYTSQLDLMQIFTENILTTHVHEVYDNPGILANDQGQSSYIKLYEIHNNRGDLSGYTRLGISADFQSLLNNLDVVKGDYGLKILIYTSMPKTPGEPQKEHPYVFDLGAADMIGNPYKYSAFSKQQKIIDISIIEDLSKIELYLYQNGDFEDSNGNLISSEHVNNILEIPVSSYPNNLFVKNIEVYLGHELGEYENDKMQIYCQNSLYYSYADIIKVKNLQLQWLHKFDNNQYKMMDMSALNDMGITLKWYRYNTNVKETDDLAGRHWEEMPTGADKFKCSFTPNTDLKEERIKVIGYKVSITKESISVLNSDSEYLIAYKNLFANLDKYKDANGEIDQIALDRDLKELQESFLAKHNGNIESVLKYTSDELVFTNAVEVFDISTFNATSALSIQYLDGSDGNYYIYNSNGKLPSANKGRGYERIMQAVYNGQTITSAALGTLDYIEWWLPTGKDSKTMLASTSAYYVKDDGEIYRENELYAGVNYVRIKRFPNAAGELVTTQSYSINNNWSNAYNNNLIRCEVSINGIRHLCSSTMHFGKSGTQGSNTTLVLELSDNNNAITIPVPKNSSNEYIRYGIEAKAFDINGDPVSPKLGEWKWQWKTPMPKNAEGKEILVLIPREDEPNIVDIEVNIDSLNQVRNGYYGIVQASFKQANEIELTTYLSIPLKAEDISHIEGATDITYSASGSPSYYSDAYKIFINTTNDSANPFAEIRNVDWDVVHDLEFYKLDKQGQPIINEFTGEKEVSTMSADYIPKLHSLIRTDSTGLSQTYQALQAAPFFAEGYDKICVTCARDNGNYKSVGFLSYYDYCSHYYYTFNEATSQFILSNTYIPKTEYFELQKDIIWVQPLLITTNNYENSTTNNWDGTLMTDEGSGTVMATIVGAGRKNSDNTFSGVLMGEVKDNSDNSPENFVAISYLNEQDFYADSYYYKDENGQFIQAVNYNKDETYYSLRQATGIYGFQNGEISFSLKDTGVAVFGKSGKGQIIMDGNTSMIRSQSFDTLGNGMKLDLDDGILEIRDNEKQKIYLSPLEPYLIINGTNEERPIMKISGEECYLQSQQRSLGGLGTHFDLVEGILDISGTGGRVKLSGRAEDPFFEVVTRQNNTLIHMDTDNYYLQSAYFSNENKIRLTNDEMQLEIYKEKDYVPVAVSIETYMSEMDKYFVEDPYAKGTYIPAEGDYNCEVQYYRLGNDDVIYGFDPQTYNLYTLSYDEPTDKYTAKVPIDVYEYDDAGNPIYPIIWFVEKYEKDYTPIVLTEEEFNSNKDKYFIRTGDSEDTYTYTSATEWEPDETNGSTGTYYEAYYIPINNEISGDADEIIVGTQIYNYVQRELTPVTTRGVPSGMKLDLVNGKIEGYNLKLVGTKIKEDESGGYSVIDRLIINTEDDELPLQIGKNFRVHWDGEVECTKVTQISYTKGPLEDTTRSVMKKVYKADSNEVVEEEVTEEIPQTFFIDFVNGQFNGMSSQAGEALSISDDILNTWWSNKNDESQDDNMRHFNVYQLKQYLQNYYIPIKKNIFTGDDTLSDYAKTSELNSLRQTVNSLSNEVAQLRNLITGSF